MVIAKLYGGLGNQMFQYAAGLAVARRLETSLLVDTTWFDPRVHPVDAPPLRSYGLGIFGISGGIPLRKRLKMRLRTQTVLREASFAYQPELETVQGDVILDGYWQSYRYFERIAPEVRKVFRFPPTVSPAASYLMNEAAEGNAVSVHVRRGDYVANPKLTRKFGVLTTEYYNAAAVEIRRRRRGELSFLVVSDDIDWCRRNLSFDGAGAVTFVEGTTGDHEDMLLMTRCQDHVIANSSFSWWGAWLASDDDKIVVAPARWFSDPAVETSDLIPTDWVRL